MLRCSNNDDDEIVHVGWIVNVQFIILIGMELVNKFGEMQT